MRSELELIAESYLEAKTHLITRSPTAEFIRTDTANGVQSALGESGNGLLVKGSPGQGRWADSPWVAVLDPLVTTTPQRGYYVAYLFSASMMRLVLSLQLGITEFRGAMAVAEAKERLQHMGALIRLRLPEYAKPEFRFDYSPIDLDSPAGSSRSGYYEAAHAFGATYSFPFPPEEQLVADLGRMVRLYRLLTFRGGITEDFDSQPEAEQGQEEVAPTLGLEDARRYRLHRRIERNGALADAAKRVHGLICQACDFNFESFYGELGRGYIEAHHLIPLGSLPKDGPIELDARKDFAVLCASCHRIIHRKGAPTEIGAFRSLFESQRSRSAAKKESVIEIVGGKKAALKKPTPAFTGITEHGDS